jgi:hypothetical protein
MYQNTLEHEPKLQLAEQEPELFNVLASVDMARYDLCERGYVAPETKQRILDEELTLIVEGVDRPHRTKFALKNMVGELLYFHKGKWRPYIASLYEGLQAAEGLAGNDHRYVFQAQKAVDELKEGYAMQGLDVGQSMVVCRRYPKQVEEQYGAKLLEDIGYQPMRAMGFICVATKQANGDVVLTSQTVDNSDEDAFLAVERAADDGVDDVDILLNIYDETLSAKHGKRFRAGRLPHQQHEDAWRLLQANQDLAEYLFDEIVKLAASPLPRYELLDAKKRLTYGVWAAFKKRLDVSVSAVKTGRQVVANNSSYGPYIHQQLQREVFESFQEASAKGEVLLACGGSIGGIMDANVSDVRDMIFGGKSETGEDKFGSLSFKCQKGHTNVRPRNQLIPRCKTCGISVKC